jgi:arsenate reductase (thioredoxin)
MLATIKKYCDQCVQEFVNIPAQRKELLGKISAYIASRKKAGKQANLIYICTHNARRSHFGQVWAHVASDYFNVTGIQSFSGGTEVTAFHPNAVHALERVGFQISKTGTDNNPLYNLKYSEQRDPIICFSKVFDDKNNPQAEFAAIMVCSDAEQNCPFVPGVDLRVLTSYDDPKDFDDTPQQDAKYDERCRQIATEILYVFSKV